MGVGNFKFSREESEREKQMEFFKNIEIEVSFIKKVIFGYDVLPNNIKHHIKLLKVNFIFITTKL